MGRRATSQRKAAGGKAPEQEKKKPQEQKQDEKKAAKRHVARRPLWVQPKMAVSQPGDALEQEAEQVARAVAKPDEKKEQKQDEKKGAAAGGAKKPDDKKGAAKLARKEMNAESKLEKKKEQQKEKAAGEAEQAAKAEETKKKEEPKKAPAEEKAARRPKITRAATGAVAPLMRRERVSEPGRADHEAGADVERRIESKRGGGAPLPPAARTDMEQKLGHDFSQVRVHDDAAAQSMAHELDAHAFTVGNDVFFGSGQLAPGTAAGDHLMAHELTHVVQQGGGGGGGGGAAAGDAGAAGGAQRVISREGKKGDAKGAAKKEEGKLSDDGNEYTCGKDRVNKESKQLDVGSVKVPKLKHAHVQPNPGFPLKPKVARADTQASVWDAAVQADVGGLVDEKVKKQEPVSVDGNDVWYLEINKSGSYVAGTKATITKRVGRPYWTASGDMQPFDVDHKLEWQLGGRDEEPKDNLWLLHASANRSIGSTIDKELTTKVGNVLIDARAAGMKMPGISDATVRSSTWKVQLMDVVAGESVTGDGTHYEKGQITKGNSLKPLHVLSAGEVKKRKLKGDNKTFTLFTNATGGRAIPIPLKEGQVALEKPIKLGSSFTLSSFSLNPGGKGGTATGVGEGNKYSGPIDGVKLQIAPHEAVENGGYISREGLKDQVESKLEFLHMSPVQLRSAEVTEAGLVAEGVIKPSIPALQGLFVDFSLRGNKVEISRTFAADELHLPGPLQMTGGALTVYAGSNGIGVRASLGFEVDKLCTGTIKAGAGMDAGGVGFSLDGQCRVREDLFDPGELKFHYEASEGSSKLTGSAELGMKTDKLKFIKSASGKVTVDDAAWGLEGAVILDIPGADEAKLTIGRAPDGTVTIGGTIAVAGKGPFKGGKLDATLTKGDDGWKAKGTGSAELAVPGLDAAKVAIDYENGAFTAIGDVAYKKGMLNGSVHAGVTNRAVGEDGQPAGEATPNLTVFGQGTVTLQIAPWLKGTVGISLLPNGEVEIKGEISLPSAIDLFPEKRFDKNLFKIGIDIPIVGFTIMGQRIGIFATIGGGLDFSAGVGPGQLRDAKLSVKYNPAHEDETQVDGSATFAIPADAGLTMKVHGGIGAGIPVVSAVAGLEVAGKVGLKAEAKAAAEVHWNPREGLKLHAEASLSAEPVFKFDVSGFVKVDIDLLLWEETLYEKRWSLASFEYGSGLKMGVTFPVDYDQQKGLDLSLDKIQIEYPQIDAGSLLESLIDKL